ncbi:MAG: cache domain-containing protein [Rhodospirillaceae bacterium]|nr:cache domain-containing protein [Rhodospirillaceae bacterium]
MKLRTSLLMLTLAVLLPALLYMATTVFILAREEQATLRNGLDNTARAIVDAVDTHMTGIIQSISVLVAANDFEALDLAAFHSEATRVVESQEAWDYIVLADESGRPLAHTLMPYGRSPPSIADMAYFSEATESGAVSAGTGLFIGRISGKPQLAVAMPVRVAGEIRYVLAIVLNPGELGRRFSSSALPEGWSEWVLDRNHRIIGGTGAGTILGNRAPADLIEQLGDRDTGTFESIDDAGVSTFGVFRRSPLTGWTVVMAVPRTTFTAAVSNSTAAIVGGGIAFLALGVGLSMAVGRRTSHSIRGLARLARVLADGRYPTPRPPVVIDEIEEIGQEIDRAAALLDRRSRQQAAIAELGLMAVTVTDRDALFARATSVMAEGLAVEISALLELMPDNSSLVLRACVGWPSDSIGTVVAQRDLRSQAGYALISREPVVVTNLADEARFQPPLAMRERNLISGMSVVIRGPNRPFGVLSAHTSRSQRFSAQDISFLQAIANILSAALLRGNSEHALAESERRARHFFESMNAVPYCFDVDAQQYTYVGPQSMRLLGISQQEWGTVGSWQRHMHPDDKITMDALEQVMTRRGEDYVLEYRMIAADNRLVWIRDIVHVEIDEKGHKILYGMAIDITESKEKERQLNEAQKLQAVGQLTGGVAHDFNNLLAVILGTSELMAERSRDDPALRKTVEQIANAAERGAALTQRLLAFSRRQALRPSETNLNTLVLDIKPLLESTLGERVVIETRLAPNLANTLIDPNQVESALVNLAINARDAMPNGGRLVIETRNVEMLPGDPSWTASMQPGAYVALSVTDSGVGMDPDIKARAFEPFFTTKDVGKGSGLGLSTIYGFVRQSGGHVGIDSEPGRGTTVRLYLPRLTVSPSAVVDKDDPGMPKGDETVLIVEDDPAVRRIVAGMVASLGYNTHEATDCADALQRLERNGKIDLVLTDIVMPGQIGGWELAQTVRERWPRTRVLLTSGYLDKDIGEVGDANGRPPILSKPYRKRELAHKIREVLQSSPITAMRS